MNRKTIYLILALAVAVGGAAALYQALSGRFAADNLMVYDEPSTSASTGAESPAAQPEEAPEGEEGGEEEERPRVESINFTVTDAQGTEVQLSDYLGTPVVLNFWASWCGPCRVEMPHFDEASQELGEEVVFLMVNINEDAETGESYLQDEGFSFRGLYDTTGEASYYYGISSIPQTYFIDSEGFVVARANGTIPADTLWNGLELIREN